MLGDLIVEGTGKTVVRKVLSTDPLTVETSFEDKSKVLGIDMAGFGTFLAGSGASRPTAARNRCGTATGRNCSIAAGTR
jgi:hypothetical protein